MAQYDGTDGGQQQRQKLIRKEGGDCFPTQQGCLCREQPANIHHSTSRNGSMEFRKCMCQS